MDSEFLALLRARPTRLFLRSSTRPNRPFSPNRSAVSMTQLGSPKGRPRLTQHRTASTHFGFRLRLVDKLGMVQVRVTAIPEVPIHGSSGFSRFRYRLDAGFRRRETIECLK